MTEFNKNCHRVLGFDSVSTPIFWPFHPVLQLYSALIELSMPFFNLRAYFPLFSGSYQFGPSKEIKCHLPAHGIPEILYNRSKPGAISSIMQMTQPEVLFHYVSFLRYLLVPLYLNLRQFGSGCIFPHYSILYSIEMEKDSIRLPIISLIPVNFFDRFFSVTTRYR